VDLSNDVSGCLDLIAPAFTRRIMKESLGIKVIDIVKKDDRLYLLLLAIAESNCNVQGYCGAARDQTLILLKLGAGLKLEEKKSVILGDCKANIEIIEPEVDYNFMGDPVVNLVFVDGKLTIVYDKIVYGPDGDEEAHTSSRLVYDRNFPEQGFDISNIEKKP